MCVYYNRGRAMPRSPHLTKTSGEPHYTSKSMKNHLSQKKQGGLESFITIMTKAVCRGILVVT